MKLVSFSWVIPERLGIVAPTLLWLPLVIAVCYWYLGSNLLLLEKESDRIVSVLGDLNTIPEVNQDVMRSAQDLLVRSRLIVPKLAGMALISPEKLAVQLDQLENTLVAGRFIDGEFFAAVSHLSELRIGLVEAAQVNVAANRRLSGQLFSILTLFTFVACSLAVFSIWLRRHQQRVINWQSFDQVLFAHSPLSVAYSDTKDTIVSVNSAYARTTGYSCEEAVGRPLWFNHSEQHADQDRAVMNKALRETGEWRGNFWYRKKNGEAVTEKVCRILLRDEEQNISGVLTVSMDSLVEDSQQKLMLWQAHHDTLTKLPNRNLYSERLSQALSQASREHRQGCLLSIDIDRFKMVNDSIGPRLADMVLMEAAMRIALAIDDSHTVARLAGNQFAIVMPEVHRYGDAERLGRDIVEKMQAEFHAEDKQVVLTASVGIALFPVDDDDIGQIQHRADAALAKVKELGGNSLAFFDPEMNSKAARRMELEVGLSRALKDEQLIIYYQPVVDIVSNRVIGAEALLRWQHPQMGMVSPGEFIPVAEESGLIVEIGAWVIQQVKEQVAIWSAQGMESLTISFNLSPRQLTTVADMAQIIELLKFEQAHSLIVEITEGVLVDDSNLARDFVDQVRKLGIHVALDDFGTGFSSLSYLREFNFDVLKIDRAFVSNIDSSSRDLGLVAAIVSIGKILGMRVIAEGAETCEQVEHLRQIGCDSVQGFYYSKPVPADEFVEFLISRQSDKQVAG